MAKDNHQRRSARSAGRLTGGALPALACRSVGPTQTREKAIMCAVPSAPGARGLLPLSPPALSSSPALRLVPVLPTERASERLVDDAPTAAQDDLEMTSDRDGPGLPAAPPRGSPRLRGED
jgi:hypothetical protein